MPQDEIGKKQDQTEQTSKWFHNRGLFSDHFLPQELDLGFSPSLDSPGSFPSRSRLELLTDQYDTCLGAVVGLYSVTGNSYAWLAGDESQGEILILADIWLKEQLEAYGITMKQLC